MQLDIPSPPSLPAPPTLVHYTLENPWPVAALLVLVAAIVFSIYHQRGQPRKALGWALSAAALAGGLVVLGRFIVTPREAIADATRSLVSGVAQADTAALDSALGDPCTLYYFQAPDGLDRAGILAAVSRFFEKGSAYRLSGWQIESLQTHAGGATTGQAQVKVLARPEQWNLPHHSWWRIDFRKGNDNVWRATAIMPLAVQGVDNPSGR